MKKIINTPGLKRIGDLPYQTICKDPNHTPPNHIVLESGIYQHTCPTCGKSMTFEVDNPTWVC